MDGDGVPGLSVGHASLLVGDVALEKVVSHLERVLLVMLNLRGDGEETYRVGSLDRRSKVLLEARVLAVLEATLAVRLTLGGLVVALAVALHVALAGSALGAGGSAGGCALLGLLVAGRLLVAVGSVLRFTIGAGRLLGLLGLVLGLFLRLIILGLLDLGLLLLGLLILGLLLLRLLLLLSLSLLVVLLMVLLVAVVVIAVSGGPKEVRAGRGDGERRDEPVAVR